MKLSDLLFYPVRRESFRGALARLLDMSVLAYVSCKPHSENQQSNRLQLLCQFSLLAKEEGLLMFSCRPVASQLARMADCAQHSSAETSHRKKGRPPPAEAPRLGVCAERTPGAAMLTHSWLAAAFHQAAALLLARFFLPQHSDSSSVSGHFSCCCATAKFEGRQMILGQVKRDSTRGCKSGFAKRAATWLKGREREAE